MTQILTDEEAILAALDEDPANRECQFVLLDLIREGGENKVADWLAREIRPRDQEGPEDVVCVRFSGNGVIEELRGWRSLLKEIRKSVGKRHG